MSKSLANACGKVSQKLGKLAAKAGLTPGLVCRLDRTIAKIDAACIVALDVPRRQRTFQENGESFCRKHS
jgi:hypothetical protein